MLFDEKRYAYHLMLQKFYEEGGITAFFNMFYWAMTVDGKYKIEDVGKQNELPDGTAEFLDAWLMLLEKMVNTKMIIESPHVILPKPGETRSDNFDAKLYLFNVQRLAYSAVKHLWGSKSMKTYNVRMCESILSIFKSIFKGEELLKDEYKLYKQSFIGHREKVGIITATVTIPPPKQYSTNKPKIGYDHEFHFGKMIELGFSAERSEEALRITENYCDAANYIFTTYPTSHITQPSNRIVITTKGEFFCLNFFTVSFYVKIL